MNGEQSLCVCETLLVPSSRAHFNGSKSARPIIAMDHVRRIAQPAQERDRRTTKESEAFKIVRVAVDRCASKVMRGFDEISGRIQRIALPDANAWPPTAPVNF